MPKSYVDFKMSFYYGKRTKIDRTQGKVLSVVVIPNYSSKDPFCYHVSDTKNEKH